MVYAYGGMWYMGCMCDLVYCVCGVHVVYTVCDVYTCDVLCGGVCVYVCVAFPLPLKPFLCE